LTVSVSKVPFEASAADRRLNKTNSIVERLQGHLQDIAAVQKRRSRRTLRVRAGRAAPFAREAGFTRSHPPNSHDDQQDHRWIEVQRPEGSFRGIGHVSNAPFIAKQGRCAPCRGAGEARSAGPAKPGFSREAGLSREATLACRTKQTR
jgi:hypothetical protein